MELNSVMSEVIRDPAIKLFGRTIPVLDGKMVESEKDISKEVNEVESKSLTDADPEEENKAIQVDLDCLESTNEDMKISSKDNKDATETKSDETKSEADVSTEKVLKKPDKILPCPRCKSMDTKFCYYNNYNVSQPRHFCKNCQRYWTAGGTMRNVPVGAGRRKSKHAASQCRHIMMPPDGLQPLRIDVPDFSHHQAIPCGPQNPMRPPTANGKVIKFGSEVPLCESMVSALNIKEQEKKGDFSSVACRESKEDPSCASSVTTPDHGETKHAEDTVNRENNGLNGYFNGVAPLPHFPYFPGAPWAYPWCPGWQNVASVPSVGCLSEFACKPENGNSDSVPWMAAPAFCPPAIPFPFIPASFWGCLSTWPNAAWSPPWLASSDGVTPTPSASISGPGIGSPTLGKHPRDVPLGEGKPEKSLWIPKTLRIDDPVEAAKSSIWATLGIKHDDKGLFKPFQSKSQLKSQTSDSAKVLHANPAALSRLQSFQESTL